jgi:hypothetical protein
VTLAAGGSSLPTDGTQKSGLVTLNDPGSGYPAWGAWTEIFAAISGPTLYVVVAFPFTTRLQLGLGATPALVIDFDETGISSDTTKILPFRLENGARLSGRSYFTGTSARKIAVTIFT